MNLFQIHSELVEQMSNPAYNSGHIVREFNVEGFWSSPITLRIKRGFCYGHDVAANPADAWEVEVTHSSGGYEGGRSSKFSGTQLDAEANFARTLMAVVELGRELSSKLDVAEAGYQGYIAAIRQQAEAERAAKEAALAADPAMGTDRARAFIDGLINSARQLNGPRTRFLNARPRGYQENKHQFVATRGWDDKTVRLTFAGSPISRKDAIAKLAEGYGAAEMLALETTD